MRTRAEWLGLLSLNNWYTAQTAFEAFTISHSSTLTSEQREALLMQPCKSMKEAIFDGIKLNDAKVKKLRSGLGTIAYDARWKQFENQ